MATLQGIVLQERPLPSPPPPPVGHYVVINGQRFKVEFFNTSDGSALDFKDWDPVLEKSQAYVNQLLTESQGEGFFGNDLRELTIDLSLKQVTYKLQTSPEIRTLSDKVMGATTQPFIELQSMVQQGKINVSSLPNPATPSASPSSPSTALTSPSITTVGDGLPNLGNSCYINASLQALLRSDTHRVLISKPLIQREEEGSDTFAHRQKLQQHLIELSNLLSNSSSLTKADLWLKKQKCLTALHQEVYMLSNKSLANYGQQDAEQFLTFLLYHLELTSEPRISVDDRLTYWPVGDASSMFENSSPQPTPIFQLKDPSSTSVQAGITAHDARTRKLMNVPDVGSVHCETQYQFRNDPDELIIQLPRFESVTIPSAKSSKTPPTAIIKKNSKPIQIDASIQIPVTDGYSEPILHKKILQSILCHSGSTLEGGHYYTIVFDTSNGTAVKYEDSNVTPLTSDELKDPSLVATLQKDAYLLFYKK